MISDIVELWKRSWHRAEGSPKCSWGGTSNWAFVISSNSEWQSETATKITRSFKTISFQLFSKFHDLETPQASYHVMVCMHAIFAIMSCICFFCILLFSTEAHLRHFPITMSWEENIFSHLYFQPQRSSCYDWRKALHGEDSCAASVPVWLHWS